MSEVKIWERHKRKVDFLPTSFKRNCWMVCVDCEKLWGRIETEFVHMVYGGSKAAVFICDNCLKLRKDGETKKESVQPDEGNEEDLG